MLPDNTESLTREEIEARIARLDVRGRGFSGQPTAVIPQKALEQHAKKRVS